jgi:hypothetical protein
MVHGGVYETNSELFFVTECPYLPLLRIFKNWWLRFRSKKSEQAGGVGVFLLLRHRVSEYFQAGESEESAHKCLSLWVAKSYFTFNRLVWVHL